MAMFRFRPSRLASLIALAVVGTACLVPVRSAPAETPGAPAAEPFVLTDIAFLAGQEKDGPMHWQLTAVEKTDTGTRAVFSDESRAFPTRIIYHRTGPDTLVARLEGHNADGSERSMQFNLGSNEMTSTTTEMLTPAGQSLGYTGGLTIAFQVKDITRSIDWYQNVAGFKLVYHLQDMGWCELSSPVDKVYVGLSQVESPKIGGPVPTWGVKDIDKARAQLEGAGVRFDGPTQEIPGMVRLATWYDPDGNALMLFQSLSDALPKER
jgi:CreA protein